VTATFALAVDVLAFSVWQILQQILQSTLAPIRQLDSGGHGFDLLDDGLANEFGPIAFRAIQIRNGANVSATRAVLVTARFLVHVDVEAAFRFVALAATNAETAQAAFIRQLEAGRSGNHVRNFAFVFQIAVALEAVDDVGHGEPQALTPVVRGAESGASLFFSFNAFGSLIVRMIWMATALAATVLLDAVAFGHHFQKFLVRFAAPVGNVRAESAGFERFGEHAPTATDDGSRRQVAYLAEFGASSSLAVDRQASVLAFTIATTKLETALAAFLRHDEASRHQIGEAGVGGGRRRSIELDIARFGNIVAHVFDREPQALVRPVVPSAECRTFGRQSLSGERIGKSRSENEHEFHSEKSETFELLS